MTKKNATTFLRVFREGTGIAAAFTTVMAFILVGFAQMTAVVLWGLEVSAPDAWFSGLLSLSSAGFGYLIGKNSMEGNKTDVALEYTEAPSTPGVAGNCPHCGLPLDAA